MAKTSLMCVVAALSLAAWGRIATACLPRPDCRVLGPQVTIFEDGAYQADIVLPATPNGVEKYAAEELA